MIANVKEFIKKFRTKLGFIAGLIVILFSKESVPLDYFIYGTVMVILGESIRIWSAGYLKKTKKVVSSGPYRFTRNPLYIGSFFILIGFMLIIRNIYIAVVLIPLFLIVYPFTIRKEEKHLLKKFGDEFKKYMEQVPRIIPRFNTGVKGEGRFSKKLFVKNYEYQTILGEIILLIIFYFGLGYRLRIFLIDIFQKIFN